MTAAVGEFEITPEMIKAGVSALYEKTDWNEEPGEWVVTRIYRAMVAAAEVSVASLSEPT